MRDWRPRKRSSPNRWACRTARASERGGRSTSCGRQRNARWPSDQNTSLLLEKISERRRDADPTRETDAPTPQTESTQPTSPPGPTGEAAPRTTLRVMRERTCTGDPQSEDDLPSLRGLTMRQLEEAAPELAPDEEELVALVQGHVTGTGRRRLRGVGGADPGDPPGDPASGVARTLPTRLLSRDEPLPRARPPRLSQRPRSAGAPPTCGISDRDHVDALGVAPSRVPLDPGASRLPPMRDKGRAQQLEQLRRWGIGLEADGREEVAAAGRAILLLIEEVEQLRFARLGPAAPPRRAARECRGRRGGAARRSRPAAAPTPGTRTPPPPRHSSIPRREALSKNEWWRPCRQTSPLALWERESTPGIDGSGGRGGRGGSGSRAASAGGR